MNGRRNVSTVTPPHDESNTVGLGASRLQIAAVVTVLVTATVAVYWGVSRSDFVHFDDYAYVVNNYHVRQGLTWPGIKWAFASVRMDYWHPLSSLSHMADIQMFGMWGGGHHLTSLAFHVLNTLLLLGFLNYTTRRFWASTIVAALFALHPLHVESVAWVTERKDVLSTFFWLLTMWAYVFYAAKPSALRYAGVIVLLAIGLMSKPMIVTLPVVLFLLDYWPLERFTVHRWKVYVENASIWRLVGEKVPLLVMAAATAAVTVTAQHTVGAMMPLESAGLALRLTNAIVSYGRYICMMVLPVNLGVLYPLQHEPLYRQAAGVAVILAAISITVFCAGNVRRYAVMGWLWYLITLLPVIGLVQVGAQSHADRYTYVPFIGLFIIVAWGGSEILARRPALKIPLLLLGLAALMAATVQTWRQVGYWRDDVTLFGRTVAVTKDNWCIMTKLGEAFLGQGQLDKAETQFRKSLAMSYDSDAYYGLAMVMQKRGKYDDAIGYYKEAIATEPDMLQAHQDLGLLLNDLHRYKEAEDCFRNVLKLDPDWAPAQGSLAMALEEQGDLDGAMAAGRKAVQLDPGLAGAHRVLANIMAGKNDYEGAAAEYKKSLDIDPDYSAWTNLGDALLQLGRLQEAEKSCRQAIAMNPDGTVAHLNLGLVLARLGRKEEAAKEAAVAISLDPNNPDVKAFYMEQTGKKP
jgi:protein O-mannosyl-transferase